MAVKKVAKNIKFEEALAELEEQAASSPLKKALTHINMVWS